MVEGARPSPLIRRFEPADFNAVSSLEEEGSGSRYGSRVFIRQASVLFSPFFFVAELGDAVTGYAIGGLTAADAGEGWVIRLKIVEGHRSRGMGHLLLDAAVTSLAAAGADKVLLTVAPGNTKAIGLYRKYGFLETGFKAGYFGTGEDRIIMEFRTLPAGRS
ncbi:MAG: GNAT family N-acetyltransferase [Methanoregulaceae archaeon]|jgi:ribosomal protein S18 acetylase RimI-like enzyme|nr:GNAT family N-acetyltransferase [Methanoregulaceae archaeon]